jgi:hypothetical protein
MRAIVSTLFLLVSAVHAAAQSAKDFSDGIGYYLNQAGKYQFLVWMTSLGAPFANILAENPAQGTSNGIVTKRDARIVTFGIDFSRANGIAPPHFSLGYCYFTPGPDKKTIDQIVHGVFPVRAKIINASSGLFASRDDQLPIYELVLPDFTRDPNFTKPGPLLWSINIQNNCDRGWLFRYE